MSHPLVLNLITTTHAANDDALDIRSTLSRYRTVTIDGYVLCKTTGEILACSTIIDYSPEPYDYPVAASQGTSKYTVDEDGSPFIISSSTEEKISAVIVSTLPTTSSLQKSKTGKGRKAQTIKNPLYVVFQATKIDKIPTPWLDNYIHGAINTGPGVIKGKYSVSPADVAKLLHLPEISVESVSGCLLNHDHEPMSIRQIQRVVEAARVALKGIALYLEHHTEILLALGVEVDFDSLWASCPPDAKPAGRKEHPKLQEVLQLLEQGEEVKAIARQTGVSKTTIKKWKQERLAA
ncbi:helix-turn-helix domain-containing protein [Pseudomonas fitomaticsae]|uniref:Helix-turn-helix domain-containing protein n=1 Tax=Pseudomonas fitomaticsae TaxID=2837969 RepID=A0ABY3PXX5_9PSED|nr:helix-turn-helix domain-containing protein [Pseudomonas fitomaticsae]UFP98428.1 helix-turn-helix domain-containing protein [Pseudomonas fitomaticsae]